MDKNFKATFDKCPCCSSTRKFGEEFAKKLKEEGLVSETWTFSYDARKGAIMEATSPVFIGGTVPGFDVVTEICLDCGAIYATKIARIEVPVKLVQTPQNPLKPNFGISPFPRRK